MDCCRRIGKHSVSCAIKRSSRLTRAAIRDNLLGSFERDSPTMMEHPYFCTGKHRRLEKWGTCVSSSEEAAVVHDASWGSGLKYFKCTTKSPSYLVKVMFLQDMRKIQYKFNKTVSVFRVWQRYRLESAG